MKNVNWLFKKEDVTKEEVIKIEEEIGVKFPKSFFECVINQNGAQPEKNIFDLNNEKGKIFGSLLDFDLNSDENILSVYKDLKDRLPNKVVPFADDPSGNYICFDYREEGKPEIVFWNHELTEGSPKKSISYIAESFEELLNKLY